MRRSSSIFRQLAFFFCVPVLLTAAWAKAPGQGEGNRANQAPDRDLTPSVPAVRSTQDLPSVGVIPASQTPLAGPPYVFTLERRNPEQMLPADAEVVSSLKSELSEKAALANFDLSDSGWHYQQVVCPSFPDYVVLDFSHGPEPNGSSSFVAALARDGAQVRVVSSFAHGALPFQPAWNRTGTFETFNSMLRHERGLRPMSRAPNWLVIGMCYAELTGHHVQVLTDKQLTDASFDMMRLKGVQPQMRINSDRSTEVTFSDVSRPRVTALWTLRFDRHGQLRAASRETERQPAKIALRP